MQLFLSNICVIVGWGRGGRRLEVSQSPVTADLRHINIHKNVIKGCRLQKVRLEVHFTLGFSSE